MAKPEKQADDLLMNNESPLARAEAEKYVEQQKSADWNRNISTYMFWGATSIMGGLALAVFSAGGIAAGVASLGIPMLVGGAAASVATFFGSVFFSRKATEISERSNVLYSDIDSQNQARRMVQSFARAQAQDTSPSAADNPFTEASSKPERSWASRVDSNAASQASSWQARIAAQADREDAQALTALRS